MENRGESAAWIGGQLDVIGLGCRRSARRVFAGVNFQVSNGEALIAVGPNGAGKSSLLRLLAGLLQLDSGAILWNGRDITLDAQGHRARVAYLGHGDAVKPALTVAEDIDFWTTLSGEGVNAGCAALHAMGLSNLAQMSCRYLSAGQRRRLAIARVLANLSAPLWILDEPTNGLDREARRHLARAFAAHRDGGGLVIAASHEELDLPGARILELAPFAAEARAADVRGLEVDQLI